MIKIDKQTVDARKASVIKAEIDGLMDDIIAGNKVTAKLSTLVARSDNRKVAALVFEFIQKKYDEFENVLTTEDADTKEAYSNFSKSELKAMIAFLGEGLKTAKIRTKTVQGTKKQKSGMVLASKVQYKAEDEKLEVKSLYPKDIVGSSEVVLFNTKYRRLSVLRAPKGSTLSVRGTTIVNIDPTMSLSKSVKNPENLIPVAFYQQKSSIIKEFFADIRTTAASAKGRINSDTLIIAIN